MARPTPSSLDLEALFWASSAVHRPRIGAERERELAELIAAGDVEALHELVTGYMGLAVKVAREWHGPGRPPQDLVQEAFLALVRAARGWRPDAGSRFTTYATAAIGNGLNKLLARDRIIGVPTDTKRRQRFTPLTVDSLDAQREREDFDNDQGRWNDVLAVDDPDLEAVEDTLAGDTARRRLGELGTFELLVCVLRYGLDGHEDACTDDPNGRQTGAHSRPCVADRLGVDRTRIRRAEERALARLRGAGV